MLARYHSLVPDGILPHGLTTVYGAVMACCQECEGGRPCAGLGQAPDVLTQCTEQLHLPAETCQQLFEAVGNDPNLYYVVVRTILVNAGAKQCAATLQSYGVPAAAGLSLCKWAIDKLWRAWLEELPQVGAPSWRALQTGVEGIHWRPCASPADLGPGEFWAPAVGGLPAMCRPLIAVLRTEGVPQSIVYIPCSQLATGMNKSFEAQMACRDRDGIMRAIGTREPRYSTGFYGERLGQWPDEFEQKPWSPPLTTAERALQMTAAGEIIVPGAARSPVQYPRGAVAVFDPITEQYRILIPA